MPRRIPHLMWLALPLVYFLYFYHLNAAGLLGPDEPRYASVGREMAHSGDWITPRLWGEPWFEKPALLYWMTATGFRLGLPAELAARLPVALLAVLFLVFYWRILRSEFGGRAAWFATLILGTCAGWVGFSQVGVTDVPLTVTFSAAMLLALPWISRGEARLLPLASALLGLAALAKGVVPLVLALPVLGIPAVRRGRWRDLIRGRVIAPFALVALPWYLLCYLRNGRVFLDVFFEQHQWQRFTSAALAHGQPWWFYIPVLAGLLLPWTPVLVLPMRRKAWRDPRRVFLLAWIVFGLVFFSAAANKLPGYVLPLLPAAAALLGIGLHEARDPRPWLAACALLLVTYPIAARVLPVAVAIGLSHAARPAPHWSWLLAPIAAGLLYCQPFGRKRLAAVAALATCATAGIVYLKAASLPEVNRLASARDIWGQIGVHASDVCIDAIHRDWRYGLNFYSVAPLPDCERVPKPWMVRQTPGEPPYLTSASPVVTTAP